MADFHTLLKHAKPEWPEEWRFHLGEVCNILRQIEARNSEHNGANATTTAKESKPVRRKHAGYQEPSIWLFLLILTLALIVGAWADAPTPQPVQDSGDYQQEIFK
jgi:hypothetical protein